jgi:DNA-binding transcriptional LysR family regulator
VIVLRALTVFRAKQPTIRVAVRARTSTELLAALTEGHIELALVGCRPDDPKLTWEPIGDGTIVLVAAPHLHAVQRGPLPLAQVAALPRVERPRDSATRALVEASFARAGAPLQEDAIAAEVEGAHALRAAVAEGLGCAFFSRVSVAADLASGKLVELRLDLTIRRELFAVWRAGEELAPGTALFLSVLRELSAPRARASGEVL